MRALFAGLALIILAFAAVTAYASEPISETQREQLLSYDFMPSLLDIGVDSSSDWVLYKGDGKTERERLLNPLNLGNPMFGPSDTALRLVQFQEGYGRLPGSALELAPELLTVEGYNKFMTMDYKERLKKYGVLVNRVTGHFFASFEPKWNPGGISVEKEEPVDSISFKDGKMIKNVSTGKKIRWQYKYWVYGSEPEAIIWNDSMRLTD